MVSDRFWGKVEKTNTCWLWKASKTDKGYGRFNAGKGGSTKQHIQAHRYAYETLVGRVEEGKVLDHLCRNPSCVNPTHLEPVTIGTNVLRGDTIPANHAKKTECPKGHPYNEENTYLYRGSRHCRACRKERNNGKS